jgi:hypothetical protein
MQFISGVSTINPLVVFYDVPGRKREDLFFVLSRDESTRLKQIRLISFRPFYVVYTIYFLHHIDLMLESNNCLEVA